MSREIKYRGIVEGSMWYASPDSDRWQQFWVLVDEETVGQYTGLKDKNGKEIYEGDIIEAPNTADDGKFTDVVVWGRFDDCCVEGETWITKQDRWQPAIWYYEDEMEVLGNIHTDPELLETKTAKS